MIADTLQTLMLLHSAHRQTGTPDFREATSRYHLVSADASKFDSSLFNPGTDAPLYGQTHLGHKYDSCWARGQALLIHGFANHRRFIRDPVSMDAARKMPTKATALMGKICVPVWEYGLASRRSHPIDSLVLAVLAAGVLMLADMADADEANQWRDFGHRLLVGCDLTDDLAAQGMLATGAGHLRAGRADAMRCYGDYSFMEVLM